MPSPRKKLWVAAINIDSQENPPQKAADITHPAFYLDGQELTAGNMRAFWTLDPCEANGQSCQTGDQCCTGFCRQTTGSDGGSCSRACRRTGARGSRRSHDRGRLLRRGDRDAVPERVLRDAGSLVVKPASMIALQAVTPEALARALACELGEARKVVSAVHRDRGIGAPIVGVRRATLEAARAAAHVPELRVVAEEASRVDPFVKYVVGAGPGGSGGADRGPLGKTDVVECVRIPLERAGRFSVCVSSQAGCALACAFCATGRLGLKRNLETWEIVEQVRVVKRRLPASSRGARRRVPGDGRADGEPRSRARRDRRPERPERARDRRARDHGVHVGAPVGHPPARARRAEGEARSFDWERAHPTCGGASCRLIARTPWTKRSTRASSTRARPGSRRCGP